MCIILLIVREEGISRLWLGVTPAILRHVGRYFDFIYIFMVGAIRLYLAVAKLREIVERWTTPVSQ